MGPSPQPRAAPLSALCPIEIKGLNRHIHEYVEVALPIGIFGSGGRDRTYDQLINSQLLQTYWEIENISYFVEIHHNQQILFDKMCSYTDVD